MAPSHKRKRQDHAANGAEAPAGAEVDTSRPTAVYKPTRGRAYTVSIALPGSIIANAQSHDAKTALASTIARACAVFSVDEIVIFSDGHSAQARPQNADHAAADAASGYTAFSDPGHFLLHILSYLETPPHLRKALFGFHPNLRTAGACPSLDMPHHLRGDEWCRWREGVTVAGEGGQRKQRRRGGAHAAAQQETLVNCGLADLVAVPVDIPPNTRVTLDFGDESEGAALDAAPADPAAPREEAGYYWGYNVRQAASVSDVLTESPHEGGYDYCVGTSERGQSVREFDSGRDGTDMAAWKHLLIVFGGVAGLEVAVKNDKVLAEQGVTRPEQLFDAWLNLVPNQGSRTIRTEEAVWLGLMGLSGFIEDRDAK